MKLIKLTDDHYVVVDNSEITQACYVYKNHENVHGRGIFYLPPDTDFVAFNKEAKDVSVITHSTQPMPHGAVREGQITGVTVISLQEIKELIGEVDVEKKVKEYYEKDTTLNNPSSFKAGYNQALEDNKEKKYTEEDLKNAVYSMWYKAKDGDFNIKEAVKASIDHVQPKTEWEVELVDGKLKLI